MSRPDNAAHGYYTQSPTQENSHNYNDDDTYTFAPTLDNSYYNINPSDADWHTVAIAPTPPPVEILDHQDQSSIDIGPIVGTALVFVCCFILFLWLSQAKS